MAGQNNSISAAQKLAAEALTNHGEDRRELLLSAADELRKDMERQGAVIRDLVLAQPPVSLLGYLWAQIHMGVLKNIHERKKNHRPDKELFQTFQFALEYVHAVWSCHAPLLDEKGPLDEANAATLLQVLEELKDAAMMYCMASSAVNIEPGSASIEFHAKSAWVLIRGHRYQVLEEEFFNFVLKPHADALRTAYSMEFNEIAGGIQAIANSFRTGFRDAVQKLSEGMDKANALTAESRDEFGSVVKKMTETDDHFADEMPDAIHDMLFGGICNLSRHTKLTLPLLEDISYLPGQNTEFFSDGDFRGTPMRTLPALIRPGIKLGNEFFATDGQFVRDSSYRAIQRGLLGRLPGYREEWNRRQKILVEQSYPTIFERQLEGAAKYSEVYFKEPKTGQWVETDLVITLGDVLLIVEAKAGVMAMHSPATNFDRHERAIRELIVKAYEQCRRFAEYLSSAAEVSIYSQVSGKYVEVGRLNLRNYRVVLPIGLTVEAFTPFSAMSKELAGIRPLLDRHPFVSMSVDDLFVLNRFLPTTGEFFHYLEVRQRAAGIPKAMLFDEIDHLGAYISNNRFDMRLKDQLKKADLVAWDSFSDIVDRHFESESWETDSVPCQTYPDELAAVLRALDKQRPAGWLEVDAHIRNLSDDGRANLEKVIEDLRVTLSKYPKRRVLVGEENPLQVWLCRYGSEPASSEMRFYGEIACLAVNATRVITIILSYDNKNQIIRTACEAFKSPPIFQSDYPDLKREADRQRARSVNLKK